MKANTFAYKHILLAAALSVLAFFANALPQEYYAANSRLASGTWVKIKITETGIYQITTSDAQKWGLGALQNVRIFGYGGAPVPDKLNTDSPDDLPQVPVIRQDDRILFFGQGPITWRITAPSVEIGQLQHPYATAGYYFLISDPSIPDMEVPKATNSLSTSTPKTSFTGRTFHELEIINPGETGREFLGEDFRYNTTQAFKFSLPGLIDGEEITAVTNFAAKTIGAKSKVTFQYNGNNLPPKSDGSDQIDPVKDIPHTHYVARTIANKFTLGNGSKELTYTITYSPASNTNLARLNYITINYPQRLELIDGQLSFGFRNGAASDAISIAKTSEKTHVWDVTMPGNITEMNATQEGSNMLFSPMTDGYREYFAFNDDLSCPSPTLDSHVANQDLHGQPTPDMIIITHSAYQTQAERIATMHERQDGMRVLVVDQEQVFNEFSSGTPDFLAYRKLAKLFFDRGADESGHKLGYLLLMGNGSFDNRLISDNVRAVAYPMLLTWQSSNSNDENNSFTSDDFLASLADDVEANLNGTSAPLDIAVGRFPVKSADEARIATNKLINYVTKPDYGAWKTNSLNIADDEDNARHMEQAEEVIVNARKSGGSDFLFNRVYIDAFTNQSTGAGRYYPDARSKMFRKLNEGVVWWNYTGHASPTGWTGDGLLTRSDVYNNLFYRHMPILYAATCEFTRYDAIAESSGENIFLNSHGGAIAVVCPPRLVYIEQNGPLNNAVARYMFKKDENGKPLRLGDIVRLGKNETKRGTNDRKYFLFGDPAMRPAYPTLKAVVKTINGKEVSAENMPTFLARQTITIAGDIQDHNGNVVQNFNGSLIANLYDCESAVSTHGYGTEGKVFAYNDLSTRLAVTVDTVKQGQFSFDVTIPSEIIAPTNDYLPSLINLYAYNAKDSTEAMGSNSDFYIYGYDETIISDNDGPDIEYLGLNSQAFADGDNVNESPLVIATISDETGLNFSNAGIGHELTLILDGKTTFSDITSYYTPSSATKGTRGSISYQLNDLENGPHTLLLKAWDVYNNMSSKTITFNVISGLKPEIADIYCDANPASIEANFYVTHNRPDANLNITLQIFDLMGRLVWTTSQQGRSDMFTSFPINWNLTDLSGNRVARGIYIYRAVISTDGIQEATKSKKIAVTGQ